MNRARSVSLLVVLLAAFLTGCADKTSHVSSNAVFNQQDVYYVERLPADERGINNLIVDNLRERGFKAKSGPAFATVPPEANYVVTYQDKWMWDITMYMLRLNMQIRNRNGDIIATGQSYRPSMQRKAPYEMIDETLDDIYSKADSRFVTPDQETDEKSSRAGGRAAQSGSATHAF